MGTRPSTLLPGEIAPARMVGTPNRQMVVGRADSGRRQLILFERGHWCAACRRHLSLITDRYRAFSELGLDVVAITHEAPSEIVGRIYPFPVFADPNLDVGRLFDVVHDDEFGKQTLRPGSLIVDDAGTILFSYLGDDSRDRPTVAAVLLAAARL